MFTASCARYRSASYCCGVNVPATPPHQLTLRFAQGDLSSLATIPSTLPPSYRFHSHVAAWTDTSIGNVNTPNLANQARLYRALELLKVKPWSYAMPIGGRVPGKININMVTDPNVLLLRVDAGLFFGNIEAVSERIEEELAAHRAARHLVLVLSAVNAIDSSALFGLLELNRGLARRDVRLHLAEVKGPVLDRLRASTLLSELSGRLFLSTANAWDALARHDT